MKPHLGNVLWMHLWRGEDIQTLWIWKLLLVYILPHLCSGNKMGCQYFSHILEGFEDKARPFLPLSKGQPVFQTEKLQTVIQMQTHTSLGPLELTSREGCCGLITGVLATRKALRGGTYSPHTILSLLLVFLSLFFTWNVLPFTPTDQHLAQTQHRLANLVNLTCP